MIIRSTWAKTGHRAV